MCVAAEALPEIEYSFHLDLGCHKRDVSINVLNWRMTCGFGAFVLR